MNKESKKKNTADDPLKIEPGNPADQGVDHNVSEGIEKDIEESYIQKQETNGGRGLDNEDDTESLSKQK